MVEGLKGGQGLFPASAAGGAERLRSPEGAGKAAGAGAARTDSARLALRGLAGELAKAPPVDAARVAEIRAGLAAGTYRIDPERIASAMIASEAPGARIA